MTMARILADRSGKSIVSATAAMTVRDVIAVLAEYRIGALPIMAGDAVAGIFSERDVLYCIAREGAAVLDRPVSEVMTAPAITIAVDTPVLSALQLMTKRRIRHLPVTDGDAMIGFVSIGDLVKHRIEKIEEEAEQMRIYIQAV